MTERSVDAGIVQERKVRFDYVRTLTDRLELVVERAGRQIGNVFNRTVYCNPSSNWSNTDFGQVFTDEHLAARDFFWDAPHPVVGPVRQLGSPMRFSRSRISGS